MMEYRVLITGASGLLGRALYKHFCAHTSWTILGLAFSRATGDLKKVDITKKEDISRTIQEFKPSVIIHSAAERRPDVVENQEEAVKQLNVDATKVICQEAKQVGAYVVYISTDYVFDGTSPPYQVTDEPNPLNKYGRSKLDGEIAALQVDKDNIILRVSVLYGEVTSWDESAVTILFPKIWDKTKNYIMSDYERRYPTHCADISWVLQKLLEKRQTDSSVTGVFHWTGNDNMTKYDMCMTMAKAFNLPTSHVIVDKNPSAGAKRPYDARLDSSRIQGLGISKHTPFSEGIQSCIIKSTFTGAVVLPKID